MARRRPKLLDLFCGAGGAAMGYHYAGFDVFGIDIEPQPNYPFEFRQMDALEIGEWIERYDVVHASPPCQRWSKTAAVRTENRNDRDLLTPIRRRLRRWANIYVIENVPGAPLINPVRYCGSSFPDLEVQRHRYFESNVELEAPLCNHRRFTKRKYKGSTNRGPRFTCSLGKWDHNFRDKQLASGIYWMNATELSQAIPPAYTEHIGKQLRAILTVTNSRGASNGK